MVEKPRNITVVIPVYEWISILVGGFDHLEKYESQLGLLFPIYGKIQMFQTTNQYYMLNITVISVKYLLYMVVISVNWDKDLLNIFVVMTLITYTWT